MLIDIRIRVTDDGSVESTRDMKKRTTLNDLGLALITLENVKMWLIENAEFNVEPEFKIKSNEKPDNR